MNDESRYQHLTHTFDPVYTENSKILILGSFPSVKSREEGFFYGHPEKPILVRYKLHFRMRKTDVHTGKEGLSSQK